MSIKVTELDRAIARNIKALRASGGLTQPQVADYLKMSYQSYQKLEGGRISFRASTLDLLARLYGVKVPDIIGQEADALSAMAYPAVMTKTILHLSGLSDKDQRVVMELVLKLKQGRQ